MQHAVKYRLVPQQTSATSETRIQAIQRRILNLLDDSTLQPFEKKLLFDELFTRYQTFLKKTTDTSSTSINVRDKRPQETRGTQTETEEAPIVFEPEKEKEVLEEIAEEPQIDAEEFLKGQRQLRKGLQLFNSGETRPSEIRHVLAGIETAKDNSIRKETASSRSSRKIADRTRSKTGAPPKKRGSPYVSYTSFIKHKVAKRKTKKQSGKGRVYRWKL